MELGPTLETPRLILRPPREEDLAPDWLESALDLVFAPTAPPGSFEFRISGEVASIVDGVASAGPADDPDVVVQAGGGAPGDLAEKVRLIVRAAYRQAKADGQAPARRIVRWRGEK